MEEKKTETPEEPKSKKTARYEEVREQLETIGFAEATMEEALPEPVIFDNTEDKLPEPPSKTVSIEAEWEKNGLILDDSSSESSEIESEESSEAPPEAAEDKPVPETPEVPVQAPQAPVTEEKPEEKPETPADNT